MINQKLVIGLYGLSGTGKTTLGEKISNSYNNLYCFIDGSGYIDKLTPGGIDGFKKSSPESKYKIREKVIENIRSDFATTSKNIIISGHYSFFQSENCYDVAWTKADAELYDIIIYLESSPKQIFNQHQNDIFRKRNYTLSELEQWIYFDRNNIELACILNNIPFLKIQHDGVEKRMVAFLQLVSQLLVKKQIEATQPLKDDHYVIFDCDGTLFCGDCLDYADPKQDIDFDKVKSIFQSYQGYSFEVFFKVAEYYSSLDKEKLSKFIKRCIENISIHNKMLKLLTSYTSGEKIILATCGFRTVWEQICLKYGLSVSVFGGNNFNMDSYIFSNEEKAFLVQALVNYGCYISAFGDSMVDIEMLKYAHHPNIVISSKYRQSMMDALTDKPATIIDLR